MRGQLLLEQIFVNAVEDGASPAKSHSAENTHTLPSWSQQQGSAHVLPLSHLSLQAGPWLCPGTRSPRGGVGAFPGNAFTAGRTAASTWAREKSLLLRRERTATSGQPVHETQTPAVSRGGVAARVRCGQPSPRSPGACSRNSLRRPRNHPFVAHCPSLKACHRKSVQIHTVSSSQDLESLLKIFLCSPLGLSKAQGFFQGRQRQEESFGICLVFSRCHYASYLTKLQTYLPIKLPVLQSFSPLIPVVTDDLEFLLMPANEV